MSSSPRVYHLGYFDGYNERPQLLVRELTSDRTRGGESVIQRSLIPGETAITNGRARPVPGDHIIVKGTDTPKTSS